jgi:hypothetical protein
MLKIRNIYPLVEARERKLEGRLQARDLLCAEISAWLLHHDEQPAFVPFRWQMTLINDNRATKKKTESTESAENENSRVENRVDRPLPINRPRELRYFGPVSVIPNNTYIRRLEHKGLLMPDTKGCILPALTLKTNAKRKKLNLPSVKNR